MPSLKISIDPVVNAQATNELKTISHLNLGLGPKTVEGLKKVIIKFLIRSRTNILRIW